MYWETLQQGSQTAQKQNKERPRTDIPDDFCDKREMGEMFFFFSILSFLVHSEEKY